MKHVPWTVHINGPDEYDSCWVENSEGVLIGDHLTREAAEALAAAPDRLEALELVTLNLEIWAGRYDAPSDVKACAKAKAAIARATP